MSKILNIRCELCVFVYNNWIHFLFLLVILILVLCVLFLTDVIYFNRETMQYEIDRDSSLLEQIMPESEDKTELVEGIPKKEDEK